MYIIFSLIKLRVEAKIKNMGMLVSTVVQKYSGKGSAAVSANKGCTLGEKIDRRKIF